jgi:hypothetical protein
MLKSDPKDLDRIILSRQTLSRYRMAGSDARVDPVMIHAECGILRRLIDKYPAKAETLGKLIEDWEMLLRGVVH